MSAFTLRWCKEHGYWEDDVDSPTEACPTCIESGAFKTRAQLERELAEALKYEQDNARERSLFLQRAETAEAKLAALQAKPDVAGLVERLRARLPCFPEPIEWEAADALDCERQKVSDLEAQLAEKGAECNAKTEVLLEAQRIAAQAQAECEGLRQDAGRFQYLQNISPVEAQQFFWNYPSRKERAKAIDSARKP